MIIYSILLVLQYLLHVSNLSRIIQCGIIHDKLIGKSAHLLYKYVVKLARQMRVRLWRVLCVVLV